ncbi:MAG: SUMF1/EgtB/PvdO family nonheme iron enzyme, partial [Deltaproteobacteria bacterium]|nr:SUMF1/EgtB/PvdO family nonheme iron enzyme [Deltaproteobacteria bacterium]
MSTTTDSISIQAAKEHPLPEYSPGTVLGGKYEVEERLGEGLLGAVYKVKAREGGKVFACKVLRKSLLAEGVDLEGFKHHLQATKGLNHPGVVAVHDAGEHEGMLFFTMDYVPGKTVRELIDEYKARGEDVPDHEMQKILEGVLEVLAHAHRVTLHRDLKPENIHLVGSGDSLKVKVSDFSIAQLISPTVFGDATLNRQGAFYMAPEMSEFRDKAEPNSDLYGVAAIFYELLIGYPPFGSFELPSAIRPDINSRVDDIIEIAMAPNPQDRFQSANDMLAAVSQAFSDLHGGGGPSSTRTLILLAVLAVVMGLASVYFRSQKETPEEILATKIAHRDQVRAQVKQANGALEKAPSSDAKYDGMTWVAGGSYVAGAWTGLEDKGLTGERRETITEVKGFWIDTKEAHFEKAEAAEGDTPEQVAEKEARNQYALEPIRDITWTEANAECENGGKRLCTEDEWEKACKGPENFDYTFGDDFNDQKCPPSGYFPPPYRVNQFPLCESGYGVWGLGGGLLEWTATAKGTGKLIKGGAVGNEEKGTRCAGRADRAANFTQAHIGFRCCA